MTSSACDTLLSLLRLSEFGSIGNNILRTLYNVVGESDDFAAELAQKGLFKYLEQITYENLGEDDQELILLTLKNLVASNIPFLKRHIVQIRHILRLALNGSDNCLAIYFEVMQNLAYFSIDMGLFEKPEYFDDILRSLDI